MPETYKQSHHPVISQLWRFAADTRLQAFSYRLAGGEEQCVLVKCEQYNPTGNAAYRLALYVLQKAYELGKVRPGDQVVEASDGESGLAYAAIGRVLGHPVKVFIPAGNRALVEKLRSYGAEVVQEADLLACRERVKLLQHQDGVFLPRLLCREYAIEAHERTTGREIGQQLLLNRLHPDAFITAAETGATVLGIGRYLSMLYPHILVHPLTVPGSDHHFRYPQLSTLNKILSLVPDDIPAIQQQLHDIGFGAGPVAAANLLGAIQLQQRLAPGSLVITVFPDSAGISPPAGQPGAIRLTGYRTLDK